MHHFNHTINNRLKFVYFIRLLLPPRSRINKCQIATISTQIDLPANYWSDYVKINRTYHADRRKWCETRSRIFCTYFRGNRDFTRVIRSIVCREVVCTKISWFNSFIESHKVSILIQWEWEFFCFFLIMQILYL